MEVYTITSDTPVTLTFFANAYNRGDFEVNPQQLGLPTDKTIVGAQLWYANGHTVFATFDRYWGTSLRGHLLAPSNVASITLNELIFQLFVK